MFQHQNKSKKKCTEGIGQDVFTLLTLVWAKVQIGTTVHLGSPLGGEIRLMLCLTPMGSLEM